ncbi:hypothetical protein ELUMI_v1c00720 [Williamsoniiplasma luminosum]|uniref:BspA family leucine-rich repeat surface protein n=1 Tax=Williamsoniiplasma luminosum TaxID=214888 RepID=A0A2K8NSI3_9MOLU|nr:BspA family leucine-rich repeat surface protein [Williamsoniiplasma luminosum]ATZ16800.1 hypothetical protein ELUMI_v1c00720 [Williamsoniiplasma luminosum]
MKKLLSILGTLGLVSTSATAIVSFAKLPRTNIPAVLTIITREQLTKLIANANTLTNQEQSKPIASYKLLHEAIGEANGTLDIYINETENFNVLTEAYERLTAAMDLFKQTDDELVNIEILKNRIANANSLLEQNPKKLPTEKTKLKNLITEIETVASKTSLRKDQGLINENVFKLQTAMLGFLNSTNEFADYTQLKNALNKASQALIDYPKKDLRAATGLNRAIVEGKKVVNKQYTTADQDLVEQATIRLNKAIEAYINAGKQKANVDTLQQLVIDAQKISQDLKPKSSWIGLQTKIMHAQGIVDAEPTFDQQSKIDQEVQDLQRIMKDFNNILNQEADLTWLKANIKMASKLTQKNKRDQDWKLLKAAIDQAEKYIENKLTVDKQDEVDQKTEDLWQATLKFISTADRINLASVIFYKTSLGVLKDNNIPTIKEKLQAQFPKLKEGRDYIMGQVELFNGTGEFSLKLTGVNDYLATTVVTFVLDIENLRYELDDLVNTKKDFWTAHQLQLAIEKKNFDQKNALRVIETKYSENPKVKRFKVQAYDKYDFSKYKGELTLYQVLDRENQDKTIYLDKNDDIKAINDSAPEGIEEFINIGWDKNGNAYQLPKTVKQVPNYISPKIESTKNLFLEAKTFNGDISKWNTSNITNMMQMFGGAEIFNGDISNWNTSNVTNMYQMFGGAYRFNNNISNWNTSNVTNMGGMFLYAYRFSQDLSKWDVQKVTNKFEFDDGTPATWKQEQKPKFN